jgi:chromosome segregation ATPase
MAMGQAAFKIENEEYEEAGASVVPFKSAQAPGGDSELVNLSALPPKIELPTLLGIISRASSHLATQKDRADHFEKRALAAEELLKAANRKVAELEIKLRSAREEVKVEKDRAAEIKKRSGEVVDKTRSMMSEALERLRAAESRAERAENGFSAIRNALEQGFTGQVA